MKRILIVIFLFLSSLVIAGEFELIYSEGSIEQKDGKNWGDLVSGDIVGDNVTVRIGPDSFAEFEGEVDGGNVFFSIIEEGTYVLKTFVAASVDFRDSGFLSIVSSKIDYLLGTSSTTREEVVMGGRGYEWDEIINWESAEKYLILGIEELEKAEIDTALDYFRQSLEQAIENEKSEIYYYTGVAYYGKGLKIKALKTLEMAQPEQDIYYFNDYSLLLGSLYIYSREYDKAVRALKPVKVYQLNKDENKQEYYLIKGIGYLKLDKKYLAKSNLAKAKEIDPGSITGKSAAALLEKL